MVAVNTPLASRALPSLAMDDAKLFESLRDREAQALGLPATADRGARKMASALPRRASP